MKKPTPRLKKWLRLRIAAQLKKKKRGSRIGIYSSPEGDQKVRLGPGKKIPEKLCLNDCLDQTLEFFFDLRKETLTPSKRSPLPSSKKKGSNKWVRSYYDFATLKNVSHGAALILAAEFDRIHKVAHKTPSAINIDEWDREVRFRLQELGFFKVLGFSDNQIKRLEGSEFPLKIMEMKSGHKVDIKPLKAPLERLIKATQNGRLHALVNAVSDAIENAFEHAYKNRTAMEERAIPQRWWISGTVSQLDRTLVISLYDQGITIPKSLPLGWSLQELTKALGAPFGILGSENAGQAIQAAMKLYRTSTNKPNRGKGLPKIKKMVELSPGGELKIISGRGLYIFAGGKEQSQALDIPLQGTYVELRAGF